MHTRWITCLQQILIYFKLFKIDGIHLKCMMQNILKTIGFIQNLKET